MGGGEGIDPFPSPKWPGVVLPERGGSPRNHAGPLPSTPSSPTGICPYFVSWGLWKEGTVHSASAGTRGEHDRRVAVLVVVLTLLIVLGWSESTAAQPIERPTDCTEAISIATIFIGHDCGEWASVLISGNVIIRKPWSRANRASRAVRLRERREGLPALAPPATVPDRNPDPDPLDGPLPADERNGNQGGTTVDGLDVELRCEATPEQTIITNNGSVGETVTDLSQRLLAEHGGLRGLFRMDIAELARLRGRGDAKSVRLKAALELGRRLAALSPEERPPVGSPEDVANLLSIEMAALEQEQLRVVLLDTKHRILGTRTVYQGSVNQKR